MSMRDFLGDLETGAPDPMRAARDKMQPPKLQRFYSAAAVQPAGASFQIHLDGKPVRTPARAMLEAPAAALAAAIADEWNTQGSHIEPATMPLTRLANSVIDGVASQAEAVRQEVANYLGSDLLYYRAATPEELVALQTAHWDPVIRWAEEAGGGRLTLAEGVIHVPQPAPVLQALAARVPHEPWRLGAVHVLTGLSGSALLALAAEAGVLAPDAVWAAAELDEDWNTRQWGEDALALARRAARKAEFDAAMRVLAALA